MSVVAMVLISRGGSHLALDTNYAQRTRALSSREGCRGVLGLFDGVLSSRAPRFAPLRSLGAKAWKMLVSYKPLACKKHNPTRSLLRLAHRKRNDLPIDAVL